MDVSQNHGEVRVAPSPVVGGQVGETAEAARISGRALAGVLKYAKVKHGSGGPAALIASLPEEHQEILARRVRPSNWYPYRTYAALLEALAAATGRDRLASLDDFGHWALRRDTGSVLKILSVFSTVEGLVHRGFGSWGNFLWRRHCDVGEVALVESAPSVASMGLRGFPDIAPAHCQMIRAYLEAMGQDVGATSIRMTKTCCVHRGDAHCEYQGDWR